MLQDLGMKATDPVWVKETKSGNIKNIIWLSPNVTKEDVSELIEHLLSFATTLRKDFHLDN